MSKCIKCGKHIPDEESRARYEELCKLGIIPMMVPMCKECRDKPTKTWRQWRDELEV